MKRKVLFLLILLNSQYSLSFDPTVKYGIGLISGMTLFLYGISQAILKVKFGNIYDQGYINGVKETLECLKSELREESSMSTLLNNEIEKVNKCKNNFKKIKPQMRRYKVPLLLSTTGFLLAKYSYDRFPAK